MDSSQDDLVLPPMNEPKCEELFDKLFDKNDNPNCDHNDDEHLNVKKPIRTYQNVKSKIVRFCDDEHDDDDYSEDDQESLDENHEPLFIEKADEKPKKRKNVRKKKLAYPNVSKDAVLEAFQKAIESKELPDFEEIEKFPLEIRTVTEQKKKRTRKSERQPIQARKPKINKKSISKIQQQNQENVITMENIPVRRSARSRKSNILAEQNLNKTKSLSTNKEEQNCTVDLFNLDESCIPGISSSSHHKNDRKSEKLTDKNDLSHRKAAAIKSSTPFKSTRSRTLRKRLVSKHNFSPNS